ncbi:hypothetical protein COY16_00745 [Candidatus Roizmanbacteria bacterium CG_4_10_14_0_2_um_filter_39_13]|uniref:Uncharacterized protein n=1 Tax=Candidatus Roizmanbacteria bacterium CG_4_10_14_0_2_um_filter_39_13 TaxID=1974825 RepID=A0A2M7U1C5_9BACT|nr:MAG: hypothetical protein COY16_00745 [Candidatus Roizmanbacteria bacterium CG_4_10_14_0_2_um_filter_39_13]
MTIPEFPFQSDAAFDVDFNKESLQAQRIVRRLQTGNGIVALDVDGVFLDGSSMGTDWFTDPAFATILPILDQNLDLRLITARGEMVIPSIRQMVSGGINLAGPHIIEEGHAWLMDGEVHPLVSQEYIQFFRALHVDLQNNGLVNSWQDVKHENNTFCWGDSRWQGRYSGSLWFRYQDRDFMEEKLQQKVRQLSEIASVQVDCHFNAQPQNDLSWMRIRSSEVNKAHRMHTLGLPDVYVCDGPNDRQAVAAMQPDILLPYMRNTDGVVIAVNSSPDQETADMRWVYENADITVNSHQELAFLLKIVAHSIQ